MTNIWPRSNRFCAIHPFAAPGSQPISQPNRPEVLINPESPTSLPDEWAVGQAYDPYVGRWSRLVARRLLEWLSVPPGARWLDVGCGTGALTQTILADADPQAVTGIDQSAGFVAFARASVPDSRARFETGDARNLPVGSGEHDAAVSGLVLNFVPQPERMAAEMARAVRPGGIVAVYVWDYAVKMQFMRHFWNAAAALDPAAHDLDEGRRFPVCNPDGLAAVFQAAGLAGETGAIEIETHFKNFDDYWGPFEGGQGPAPSYVAALSPDRRAALRERLRTALPYALDGSIPLVARAWAIRATR